MSSYLIVVLFALGGGAGGARVVRQPELVQPPLHLAARMHEVAERHITTAARSAAAAAAARGTAWWRLVELDHGRRRRRQTSSASLVINGLIRIVLTLAYSVHPKLICLSVSVCVCVCFLVVVVVVFGR